MGNKQIPKVFFEPPSNLIRNRIREGPQIQTKKGLRHNLYVPLSFVKSSECAQFPESIRKELVDISSSVISNLDNVNKLSINEAAEKLHFFNDCLKYSYYISDTCRAEWRRNAYCPSPEQLENCLVKDFTVVQEASYDNDVFAQYTTKLKDKVRKLTFSPAYEEASKMEEIKSSIVKALNNKKANRGKPR